MENQTQPQQQSTEKYFFFPRWLVGVIFVAKRLTEAMVAYSIGGHKWDDSMAFFIVRVTLSLVNEVTAVRNPTVTVLQTTPPPAETATMGSE